MDAIYESQAPELIRRLERMLGSREQAEDVGQEAFLRLMTRGPAGAPAGEVAAWLNRTARNLAIDELRRRRVRRHDVLDESTLARPEIDSAESLDVQEALSSLTAHERLLVLLRFQAGLSHGEIGGLLDISQEAARKRVAGARRAFIAHYREGHDAERPTVLLAAGHETAHYARWLSRCGADIRPLRPGAVEPQVELADAVVMGGDVADVHPALYGERPRARIERPDLERDRRNARVVRAALAASRPYLGVCMGAQLMNVALGGDLYQDLGEDGVTRRPHWGVEHRIRTEPETLARRILGREPKVPSEHHQAVRRLGEGVRASSSSTDSICESVELPGARFALGVQWHPERDGAGRSGDRLAEALLEAARESRGAPA